MSRKGNGPDVWLGVKAALYALLGFALGLGFTISIGMWVLKKVGIL